MKVAFLLRGPFSSKGSIPFLSAVLAPRVSIAHRLQHSSSPISQDVLTHALVLALSVAEVEVATIQESLLQAR